MWQRKPSEGEGLSKARFEVAQGVLEDAVAGGQVGAATTAILHKGKLVHLAAFGQTGWPGRSAPVVSDSIFLIASLTKPIVCAGMMLLVQDGQLRTSPTLSWATSLSRRPVCSIRVIRATSLCLPLSCTARSRAYCPLLSSHLGAGLTSST